jgi:hypothetical protein
MRVLIIGSYDAAAQGQLLAEAMRKHLDWEAMNVILQQTWLDYKFDKRVNDNISPREVMEYAKSADFIIFQDAPTHTKEMPLLNVTSPLKACVWGLGSRLRASVDAMAMNQIRRGLAISVPISEPTIAPQLMCTSAFENVMVDFDGIKSALKRSNKTKPEKGIGICHTSTNPGIKGTATFDELKKKLGKGVTWQLIEKQKWDECIRIKARQNILVDTMEECYGISALESIALGQRVVSNLGPWGYSIHPDIPIASFNPKITGLPIEEGFVKVMKEEIKKARTVDWEERQNQGHMWVYARFAPDVVVQRWKHWINWVKTR